MKQEDLNGMMRSPGEAKTAPAPAELPRCPECGERYLGDGMALCAECAAQHQGEKHGNAIVCRKAEEFKI